MPSQLRPEMMPSVHSARLRSTSVSSIRRMKVPLCCRAKSQLKRAVRALPTCKKPVGEGAKRTRGALTARRRSRRLLLADRDRLRGAAADGLFQLRTHGLRRVLVEDVEVAVVAHLEDL